MDKQVGKNSQGLRKSNRNKKRKAEALDSENPDVIDICEDKEKILHPLERTYVELENIRLSALSKIVEQEPSIAEIESPNLVFEDVDKKDTCNNVVATLCCKTIRIGSYKYIPKENLAIRSNEIVFNIPKPNDPSNIINILLKRHHVIKVLVSYYVSLRVIFFYVAPSFASNVRKDLNMINGSDIYFDPTSNVDCHKRITLVCEDVKENTRVALRRIYTKPTNIINVVSPKEANELLLKSTTKIQIEFTKTTRYEKAETILYYPSISGESITTADYMLLEEHQLLNDKIIDFYLKYLVLNLPQNLQKKIHIFSTFFYSRLSVTNQNIKSESYINQMVNRYEGVKTWTKNVNLFEKDFVVVPINENSHWLVAIICFPGMNGCSSTNNKMMPMNYSSHEYKFDPSPIQQPCILIFDSLFEKRNKEHIASILRGYLTCEYHTKIGAHKEFSSKTMEYCCPQSPQQQNRTDCGLYLLQNVEHFFTYPINNYRFPIQNLRNWYDPMTTKKKRKDIAMLIQELMMAQKRDPTLLPNITFPSLKNE